MWDWADSSPMSTLALDCSRARSNSAWVTPCSVGSPDHGQNGVQRLSLGLPPQGGVDAEVAGIVMAGAVRVDGVAKPLLLLHLLKLNHNPDETVDITWSALQYRLDESVGYPKIG